MLRYETKIISGVIMFVTVPICFLLPVKMADVVTKYGARGQLCLDLLSCFAGGVFLSSYLVFMAPPVRVLIEKNIMKPNGIVYPLPDMLIGLGFFVMLALDKLVHFVSARTRVKSAVSRESSVDRLQNGGDRLQNGGDRFQNGVERFQNGGDRLQNGVERLQNGGDRSHLNYGMVMDDGVTNQFSMSVTRILPPRSVSQSSAEVSSRNQGSVELESSAREANIRSLVMMLALSIDSVIEGMTVGLKETVVEVWGLFIGIIVHEAVISFCLGLQMVRLNPNRLRPVILACTVYTLMNPTGVLIATAIYETMENEPGVEIANGILQAITAGCFIYIIFYVILEGQITPDSPLSKLLAIFVGYVFLSAFAAIPSGSDSAENSDCSHCFANLSTSTTVDNVALGR